MPGIAVIPVKQFSLGKGRLAETLGPKARADLGRALATRTAQVTVDAGMEPLIVAGDDDVSSWALGHGFQIAHDSGTGLNGAARIGVEWCLERSLTWIVIHADLPLLLAPDVSALLTAMEGAPAVVAPSSDGGTSALGATSDPPVFQYGVASFRRHLFQLPRAQVVARVGLFHDLDTPADLESARRHLRGGWINSLID